MPSSKRQRELARRRAERQATRRAEERARRRQRRRRAGIIVGCAALALLLVVGAFAAFGGKKKKGTPAASLSPSTSASVAPGTCVYTPNASENTGGKKPGIPPKPAFGATKTLKGTLALNAGTVEITLLADKAPCTVNSFKFLAAKKFFDGTKCHRETNSAGLTVLQCGDPTGTGQGGPGYKFTDENLPKAAAAGTATYPRGTVAMANAGAGTNGSQFFLVIKNSTLPPNYTVFGTITKGLDVLDRILAAGIAGGSQDGAPKNPVMITSFRIG